jgi:GT2 family glycosyltransferase
MFDLAIIVVNWNSGRLLESCLESTLKCRKTADILTIVVDNGSIDGSELVADNFPGVQLVRAGSNLGFARACNLGAMYARDAEYLLFLNPDAELRDDTVARVIEFMRRPLSSGYGICGVALFDQNGNIARSCSRFPTPARLAAGSLGLDRVFPRLGTLMREWDHTHSRDVDQVIGAFFFVRHDLFRRLAGFDERYFVYFEEVDFSKRAFNYGYRTYFLADAAAFHLGGGTSSSVKSTRLFYSLRSRLIFSRLHFSFGGRSLVILMTCLIEPISRIFLCILSRNWPSVAHVVGAYGLLIRWLCSWGDVRGA